MSEPDQERLIRALRENDLPSARLLLERGLDSAAAMAEAADIETGHAVAAIALLLELGSAPNVRGPVSRFTPMMRAAALGDATLVRALLAAGADPRAAVEAETEYEYEYEDEDEYEYEDEDEDDEDDERLALTALDVAANAGRYQVVELLFVAMSGAEPPYRSAPTVVTLPEALVERTAWAAAALETPAELTALLDRHPHFAADPVVIRDLWHVAASETRFASVLELEARALAAGCELPSFWPHELEPAWTAAATAGDLALMAHLDQRTKRAFQREQIDAALYGAACCARSGVVTMLLARGPSSAVKLSSLWAAAGNPAPAAVSIVEQLLDAGADPSGAVSEHRQTPLMTAAGSHNLTALRLLIARGADVHARDAEGRTAMAYCADRTDAPATADQARALLRARGARPV
jgi:ankyrin repeat protein